MQRFVVSMLAPPYAFGTVKLWGRIAQFEHGHRAEWAKPLVVSVVGATAKQQRELADFYQCEIKEASEMPGLSEAYKERLTKLLWTPPGSRA